MRNKPIGREGLEYSIGPLLYTPAYRINLVGDLESGKYNYKMSVAFCLEDAIGEEGLEYSEKKLLEELTNLKNNVVSKKIAEDQLPKMFIRVRNPEHLEHIYTKLGELCEILIGFILPKFDSLNAEKYITVIGNINKNLNGKTYFFMPVLETEKIIYSETRINELLTIKEKLDSIYEFIINVRVGGNDFCNYFGYRRNSNQTIYDILILKDVITDILNIFLRDYVVSAPVWEYFDNGQFGDWEKGLKKEIELDRLNGFVGKTAIHPSQVEIILNSLKVSKRDYEDALRVISWEDKAIGVEKSSDGRRMNEAKVHLKWAKKILTLYREYGVSDE